MRFLRIQSVVHKTGLSRTTIWRLERAGKFPKRRQISPNAVAWVDKEIEEWMEERPEVEQDA